MPEESDPLLLVRPEDGGPAARALADALLQAPSFAGLPEPVARDAELDDVDRVAYVGTETSAGSGAVIWARWSEEDWSALVEAIGLGGSDPHRFRGQPLYASGDTAGARLADRAFAIGTTGVVRSVVDVWHGDGEPVDDDVLRPFERTVPDAPVRFATTGLALAEDPETPPAAYRPVRDTSVSIGIDDSGDGSDAVVTVAYEVESSDAGEPLATALERDLGLTAAADPVEPALPRGVRGDLSVEFVTQTVVGVEYRAAPDLVADSVGDVLATLGSLTAGP